MTSIIFAGFGGQGVLTAGLILAKTAMDAGDMVTWIPSYGSEMRGGTANCNIKIAKTRIGSPFIRTCDILVALNQPSADKFVPMLKEGGVLVVNSSLVKKLPARPDLKTVPVDATVIAERENMAKSINILMLGAVAASGAVYGRDVIGAGIERFFTEKGKINPNNAKAFRLGFDAAGGKA
jgi:2-oxoglutarate ferredoxin oxidoreductase subunit gamma